MHDTWRIPWHLLGLPDGAEPPRRVAVRIAPPDLVPSFGGGFVLTPETFERDHGGLFLPAAAGLYDEDTFGPLPRGPGGGVDFSVFETAPFARRPQIIRPGEIVLAAGGLLHPWLRRFALERVAEAAGVALDEAEGLLAGRLVLDHDERVVEVRTSMAADEVAVGAEALWRLARRRGRVLEGYLRIVPVLPAGLRFARVVAGELTVPAPTRLYQAVLRANEKVDRCRAQAVAARFLASAVADLQACVEAIFLDGLDRDDLPPAPGEAPALASFKAVLGGAFGAACLQDLAGVADFDSFVRTLRGPVFQWRAIIEASCLEVVLLTEDGAIDEAARRKIFIDHAAHCLEDVYALVLGGPWLEVVMHGPLTPELPHVDVLSFAPRSPGGPARLVTAGMSTALMGPGPGVDLAELTALVRADVDRETAETIMDALLRLGLFPFRHRTSLGPGHDVRMGAPLLPGSKLMAWVLYAVDDQVETWAARACDTLPRHPEFLLAAAVTEDELEHKLRHGSAALRERLEAAGALAIDPRRASCLKWAAPGDP